jgi:hypothetical protein
LWGESPFVALSPLAPSGQALYLFLLTGPFTVALPGVCHPAGRAAIAEALGWATDAFDGAFRELFEQQLAVADWHARLIFLRDPLRDNEPQSPNVLIAWSKAFAELPDCDLRQSIAKSVGAFVRELGPRWADAWQSAIDRPCTTKPFVEPSRKASRKASPNQDQDQKHKQRQKDRRRTDPWASMLDVIEPKVTRHDFHKWFKDTRLVKASGHRLVVSIKNQMYANWIDKHFGPVVKAALASVVGRDAQMTWSPREKDSD